MVSPDPTPAGIRITIPRRIDDHVPVRLTARLIAYAIGRTVLQRRSSFDALHRYEKRAENYAAMITLAVSFLALFAYTPSISERQVLGFRKSEMACAITVFAVWRSVVFSNHRPDLLQVCQRVPTFCGKQPDRMRLTVDETLAMLWFAANGALVVWSMSSEQIELIYQFCLSSA